MRGTILNETARRLTGRAGRLGRYLPGVALGLFLARVTGEQFGMPNIWAAVLLSLLLGGFGAWMLARRPLRSTWPAFLLLAYVAQPEVRPSLAVWTAAIALAAFLLSRLPGGASWSRIAQGERFRAAIGLGLFAAFLALYVATLAPGVLAADSGELQTVAAQLGVAHPPGFPLYVMFAHLFTRLPVASPAWAVNLFSVVTSALTVLVVYRSGRLLTGRQLPAIVGAVALGTATTFWSQATTANVRSLTALFAALIIHALLEFRIATRTIRTRTAGRQLNLIALLMGLGLAHHISLLFLIAVGLLFLVWVDPVLLRQPRRWGRPIAFGLLGLLPLLYLPLRANAEVRGASPALATVSGFVEHALATGFRGDLFYYLAPVELLPRLRIIGNVMTFQFAPLLLVGMLLGLLMALRRDRPAAWLLGGTFFIYAFVAATYRAPQTVEYMMPAYVPAALLLVAAVAWLPGATRRAGIAGAALATLFTALVLVFSFGQLIDHVSAAGAFHERDDARRYAATLLDGAPPGSVILAHWHWATPLWYMQEVEAQRPDVDVRFVFPEGEPYEATWARRTAEAHAGGRPVVTTWVPTSPLPGLPPPEPLGEALLYPQHSREANPPHFTAANLALGNIQVTGYAIEPPERDVHAAGEELIVTVAWEADEVPPDRTMFLHLVGADGILYGQDDQPVRLAEGVRLTQFRVTPRPATPAGEMRLFIGQSSDGRREELAVVALSPPRHPLLTRNPVTRRPDSAGVGTLVGYDWDHTLEDRRRLYLHWEDGDGRYRTQVVDDAAVDALALPPYRGPWGVPVEQWRFPRGQDGGHYVPLGEDIIWTGETINGLSLAPGESTVLDTELRSGRPINRDYVVSVRLIGLEPDGFHWAWWDLQDSIPAMGAIPTLKWVEGSFVRSPHRLTVATDAPPGQTLTGALTLYDAFTNRPLPILDERITDSQPWIPLCRAVVE